MTKPLRQSQLHDCLAMVVGLGDDKNAVLSNELITRHRVLEAHRRNVRILLVEDNITNQEVAMVTLKKLGYRADLAANGVEAIKLLSEHDYSLVLMDCQMPEMDGFETTESIRSGNSKALNPAIPIIAMTANAMQGDRERCLAAGMNDYIAKPVRPAEMLEKISLWLSRVTASKYMTHGVVIKSVEVRDSQNYQPLLKVFDEKELLIRLMNDENLLHRIIRAFESDTPGQLLELHNVIEAQDYDTARRLAHNIKGSAANISAPALKQAALELEVAIKEARYDQLAELLVSLDLQMDALLKLMRARGYL